MVLYTPFGVRFSEPEDDREAYGAICGEESCLTLHRSRAQRAWRVPVRDVETVMHDPALFGLAKQIEAALGRRARFMLRPGGPSEIRILVEAPNEEKCLLAMLRFTRAAEKKGVLTGPAEEEEL